MSRGKTIVVLILFLALSACGLLAGGAWLVLRQAQPGPSPSSGQAPADAPETADGASAALDGRPASAPDAARRGGSLTLPGSMPSTLDPALVRDVGSAAYMYEIYSGLVTLSPELEVVPDLAERWEIGAGGTEYTFHLRGDARFQDGSLVTADALAFAIERGCDPATGSLVAPVYLGDIVGCLEKLAGQRQTVTGLRVPDARTLVLTIDAPKAYFLAKLTYPTAFALDPLQLESDPDWQAHPNGSGPFRLVELIEDERAVLERNPGYPGPGPWLDRVVFDLRPAASVTLYENGELDATPVGLADIERVRDPLNPLSREVHEGAGELGLSYIAFDLRQPPFDDPHLRRALNYALDKAKLAEVVMRGTVIPVYGILPPGMPGFDAALSPYRFDPALARQELAASRYGGPAGLPPITLNTAGLGGEDPLAMAVADELAEVLGIDVALEQAPWETFQAELEAGAYPMYSLGWSADYADPQDFLDVLFHGASSLNHGGYANPAVDALLEAARVEADPERRLARYAEAERAILEDAPWVPLFTGRETWLVAPYVRGFAIPPITLPRLQRVWIEAP
ncbi:MAG: peptide ABC transporter substrate-binding protein [Caldilineae bacterium]|nr:peptide ABC transporter substrate-binding protein [Caldilineae bacterium]